MRRAGFGYEKAPGGRCVPGQAGGGNEAATNKHAIKQVKEQVDALIAHEGWKEEKVSGVVCDGRRFIYCRRSGSQWIVESPVEVDEWSEKSLSSCQTSF